MCRYLYKYYNKIKCMWLFARVIWNYWIDFKSNEWTIMLIVPVLTQNINDLWEQRVPKKLQSKMKENVRKMFSKSFQVLFLWNLWKFQADFKSNDYKLKAGTPYFPTFAIFMSLPLTPWSYNSKNISNCNYFIAQLARILKFGMVKLSRYK